MPDLERILQLTPGSLSQQWYEDGAAVDPGAVTIGVTRADGTALIAAGTATTGSGTGSRTYNLTTTHTALLDRLTVTWTSTLKGTLSSYLEVVGGFLFSIADLSAELVGTSTVTYTAAQIAAARIYAETELENACGLAFVPRYALETFSGHPTQPLRLRSPVRAVRSATADGSALSAESIAGLYTAYGFVTGYTWPSGLGNIVVGYEHGMDYPPPGASEAALVLAKHKLVKGPIDERATQRPSEFGPVNLATPGMFGARFGIPVVDAFVVAARMPSVV